MKPRFTTSITLIEGDVERRQFLSSKGFTMIDTWRLGASVAEELVKSSRQTTPDIINRLIQGVPRVV